MPWVSQEKIDQFRATHDQLQHELERLKKLPYLVGIERVGRTTKFTFVRNGEFYVIETMSMLSDNLKEWKEKLLR